MSNQFTPMEMRNKLILFYNYNVATISSSFMLTTLRKFQPSFAKLMSGLVSVSGLLSKLVAAYS